MSKEPTDAEVAAAQDILARRAEANRIAANKMSQPIRDLVNSPEFKKVRDIIDGFSPELANDGRFQQHINALRTGMNGLVLSSPEQPAPPSAA